MGVISIWIPMDILIMSDFEIAILGSVLSTINWELPDSINRNGVPSTSFTHEVLQLQNILKTKKTWQ